MNIFQFVGFILAILSFLGPSIKVVQFIQAHIRSFRTLEFVIHQHLHAEEQNQRKLQDLRNQLIAYQPLILATDLQILMDHIVRMHNNLTIMHNSLLQMGQCATNKLHKFMNASKWAHECRGMESELEDVENRIFFINMWLSNNATVTWEEYVQGLLLNNSLPGSVGATATIRTRIGNFMLICMKSVIIVGIFLVTIEVILLHLDQ